MLRALTMVLATFFATNALADRRVALVIGNSDYAHATRLPNPQNDARAIGDKLTQIGFEVFLHENLGGQDFRVALGTFAEEALRADLAVVFYAGHGIEMGGRNYLIPIDAKMTSEATAQFEAISLDNMLTTVRNAGKMGLVMLDACRDNPFANTMEHKNGTRAVSRGLAAVSLEGEAGTLVSFAAQAGDTADDGDGMHSPYTEALLQLLAEPGLEIGALFQKVTNEVKTKTQGRQRPMYRLQPPEELIYLVPVGTPPQPSRPSTAQNTTPTEDPMVVYLNAVKSGAIDPLSDYLRRYPTHEKAADARQMIFAMEDEAFWKSVSSQNTESAYRRYLLAFSEGAFADQAAQRLADFARSRDQKTPTAQPTAAIPRPSFDCAKASTPVEHAICGDAQLAQLDVSLAATYKSAVSRGSVSRADQSLWIKLRGAVCAQTGPNITTCLDAIIRERISALSNNRANTQSPGFNCARASTAVERAICAHGPLSIQDQTLWNTYVAAESRGTVQASDETQWIKWREKTCGAQGEAVAQCVAAVTSDRIRALQ